MRNVLIYNPQPGPRSNYVFSFIFDDVLEWQWKETTEYDTFFKSDGIKINYSGKNLDNAFNIPCHNFLNEKRVNVFEPSIGQFGDLPVLFPTEEPASINFDIFSAIFYMISRYEEYLPEHTNQHGRYPVIQSIAYRNKFIDRPVVDEWIYAFATEIKKMFSDAVMPSRSFSFQPTIDIDNAFAFRHKGLIRSIGGFLRSLIILDFAEISFRARVLIGNRKDPYDTYNFIKSTHRQLSLSPYIFILGGSYGKFDKNISNRNRHFRKLVIEAATIGEIGLHPSYHSSLIHNIKSEKEHLEKITGKKIRHSRQHFLMIKFPETYRMLIKAGITHDYSMGYSNCNGFRAGTCTPFYFYDLLEESRKDILIHPFHVIDVAFKHQDMSREESISQIELIIDRVKSVNGVFVSVWHNESLGNYKKWSGWKEVYKRLIKLAVHKTDPYE